MSPLSRQRVGKPEGEPVQENKKSDALAAVEKHGWTIEHAEAPSEFVPEWHGKTSSNRSFQSPGKYKAFKQLEGEDGFHYEHGESPEKLLEAVEAWENRLPGA